MKKIILFLSGILFLCGCSNKLTCTYKEIYEDVKIVNKIKINFNDKIYK